MSGNKHGRLSIAYVGSALEEGRMDAVALADGLKGTARFVNRVAEMQLGPSSEFKLEVEGEPKLDQLKSSFVFPTNLLNPSIGLRTVNFLLV